MLFIIRGMKGHCVAWSKLYCWVLCSFNPKLQWILAKKGTSAFLPSKYIFHSYLKISFSTEAGEKSKDRFCELFRVWGRWTQVGSLMYKTVHVFLDNHWIECFLNEAVFVTLINTFLSFFTCGFFLGINLLILFSLHAYN